eukprot:8627081-Pyramimonas_sp.AAC.1
MPERRAEITLASESGARGPASANAPESLSLAPGGSWPQNCRRFVLLAARRRANASRELCRRPELARTRRGAALTTSSSCAPVAAASPP